VVLIAPSCFGLPEITTPALGAPPLLNREGSYPEHSQFSWRAEGSWASVRNNASMLAYGAKLEVLKCM